MAANLQLGIDTLLDDHASWVRGKRVGLVAHPASRDGRGTPSWERLHHAPRVKLRALFGPEHGFLGAGGAGEEVGHARHPEWKIPVYSLYGDTRAPTDEMMAGLDVLVFDLQDLAARCYTYVSTLIYVLKAAARHHVTVIVADRPVPLPNTIDGPMLDSTCKSFVGLAPVPLAYGMTPGETAHFLKRKLRLDVELKVATMGNYHRESLRPFGWPRWIPPSPAIRSWLSGQTYLSTVFCEALPTLDCARSSPQAFQLLRAPWLDASALCRTMDSIDTPGMTLLPEKPGRGNGVRIVVHDPDAYKPVALGITLLRELQRRVGKEALWDVPGTRPKFFDLLMGTASVRNHLQRGGEVEDLLASWRAGSETFLDAREKVLLYRVARPSPRVARRSHHPRKAVVLAAGLGMRMKPLNRVTAKAVMPMWNRPMLRRTLEQLKDWGVERVVVNAHYLAGQVLNEIRLHTPPGLEVQVSFEPELLGTGGALPRMKWFFDDEPFWMVNADVAAELDPDPLLQLQKKDRTLASLWLVPDRGPRTVTLRGDTIEKFLSPAATEEERYTFSGLHLISPKVLSFLPDKGEASIIVAYQHAMARGWKIRGATVPQSYWADIGTPPLYLRAHRELAERARHNLAGQRLYVGEVVTKQKDASAEGWAAVDGAARCRKGARVADSVVLPGAELTKTARVAGAVIAPGTVVSGVVEGPVVSVTALDEVERKALETYGFTLEKASAEFLGERGSERMFYRIGEGRRSAILVRYEPRRRENRLYAQHADFLLRHGVSVPAVLYEDPKASLLLLEDVGRKSLEQVMKESGKRRRLQLYQRVIESVCGWHRLGPAATRKTLPLMKAFGPSLYAWEVDLFCTHYVKGYLGLSVAKVKSLARELGAVARVLKRVKPTLIHRDLQSSNIYLHRGRPTFIDFQGMRMGAAAYDMASLLCDPYLDLSLEEQEALLAFAVRHHPRGKELRATFWWAAVQRLCQALGAYGRLGAQPGTAAFIRHIPPAARMLRRAARQVEKSSNLSLSISAIQQ